MKLYDSVYGTRSDREKRFILIAVIIGLIVLLVNFVFDPIRGQYLSYREEVSTKTALLKRYQTLVNTTDKTRENLFQTRQMSNSISTVLLTANTADLASAELQGIAKSLAGRANIVFSSIKPNKSNVKEGFLEISLTVPFTATIRQIQQFLFDVEQAPQLLSIKQFQVRSQKKDKNQLSVEMEIAAFIRAGDVSLEAPKSQTDNGTKPVADNFDAN